MRPQFYRLQCNHCGNVQNPPKEGYTKLRGVIACQKCNKDDWMSPLQTLTSTVTNVYMAKQMVKRFQQFLANKTPCLLNWDTLTVERFCEGDDYDYRDSTCLNEWQIDDMEYNHSKATLQECDEILYRELDHLGEILADEEGERRAEQQYNNWCRQNDVDDIGVYN